MFKKDTHNTSNDANQQAVAQIIPEKMLLFSCSSRLD
jgi:hypothetical protein